MDFEGFQVGVQTSRIYLEISNIDLHALEQASIPSHCTEAKYQSPCSLIAFL